jgi:hypothetical protein
MSGSSTHNSVMEHDLYAKHFPELTPLSQRLPIARGTKKMSAIERNLTNIMKDVPVPVQLVRPRCPSPNDLKFRVNGVITGWNPPISLKDCIEWDLAYIAYQRATWAFNTTAKLGDFPPMIGNFFTPVHD